MHLSDSKISSTPAPEVPDASSMESAAPDNMDNIVEGLLIAGLHSLDDDDLPVQTNEFYSKAVLGCKPAGRICLQPPFLFCIVDADSLHMTSEPPYCIIFAGMCLCPRSLQTHHKHS